MEELKEHARVILYSTMAAHFNLDLLPRGIRGKVKRCRQNDYELLGAAGYLWALCPKNPWHQELETWIKVFSGELFK